jgi:hypothetical protein
VQDPGRRVDDQGSELRRALELTTCLSLPAAGVNHVSKSASGWSSPRVKVCQWFDLTTC